MRNLFQGVFAVMLWWTIANSPSYADDTAWQEGYALLVSGSPQDLKLAQPFLDAAHGEGDERATFAIGLLKMIGHGYEKDVSDGLVYLTDAADRGLLGAQALAAFVYNGAGTANRDLRVSGKPQLNDKALAEKYVIQAREGGSITAIHSKSYQSIPFVLGHGATREDFPFTMADIRQALQFSHTAWLLGNSGAEGRLEDLYRGRFGSQIKPTREELRIMQEELWVAVEALERLARKGDLAAQVRLGLILRSDFFKPPVRFNKENRDDRQKRGLQLLREAAEAGHGRAKLALCSARRSQGCVDAAAEGYTDAMRFLALRVYGSSEHPDYDISKALHLTWNAAFLGDAWAEGDLYEFYRRISARPRSPSASPNTGEFLAGLIVLFGVLAANAADTNGVAHQSWDSYSADQQRLQRQVNELSAIGWTALR